MHRSKINTAANKFITAQQGKDILLCLSHLRWDFVYQRPQHLMTRFAGKYNVLYVEEPIYINDANPYLVIHKVKNSIFILVPHIPKGLGKSIENTQLLNLLNDFILKNNWCISVKWYLTPMMLPWTENLVSKVIIYDCMDELTAFKNAPPQLKELEQELMRQADLVFTGGVSLYKTKSRDHQDVYLFPSGVDIAHFIKARGNLAAPADQKYIPQPRIGFYGVIDERLDIKLLKGLATYKPEWHFIVIGPVVKIDINDLPQLKNIHYLGIKSYSDLPHYLSGWDVAFMPFATNESTKFISPTKTPEYIAAGRPVVSTPIADVIATYQNTEIVHIADPSDLPAFINAIELALEDNKDKQMVHREAELVLQNMSWDRTFLDMHNIILQKQFKESDYAESYL